MAVPYLPNPAVIASDEIDSILFVLTLVGLVLLVGLNDFAVFKNMGKLSKHLDLSRLAVTVVVLGALLAASAVQSMVNGLAEMGVNS